MAQLLSRGLVALVFLWPAACAQTLDAEEAGLPPTSPVELPLPDPRVQWSDEWRAIVYRPDGGAVAAVGYLPTKAAAEAVFRADVVDVPRTGALGVAIVELSANGPQFAALPADLGSPASRGAWAPDSSGFAQVLVSETSFLGLFDSSARSWRKVAVLDSYPTSNVSWFGRNIAVLGMRAEARALAPEDQLGRQIVPHLCIVGSDGSGERGVVLSELGTSKNIRGMTIGWDPTGRFIAVAASDRAIDDAAATLLMVDARSMDVVSEHTIRPGVVDPDASIPQWAADGSSFVLLVRGAVYRCEISSRGEFSSVSRYDIPGVIDAVWCPGERSLLVMTKKHEADVGETFETVIKIGENITHRYGYHVGEYVLATDVLHELKDFARFGREDWRQPYMLPRVGEAFSSWAR